MKKIQQTITANVYKEHESVYRFITSITSECKETFETTEGRMVLAFVDSITSWEYAIEKLVKAFESQQREADRVIDQIKKCYEPNISTDWRIEEYKAEYNEHKNAVVQLCYVIGIDSQTRTDLFKLITELTFKTK